MQPVHSYCDVFSAIRLFLIAREFSPEDVRLGVADGHAILADLDRVEGTSLEAQETYLRQFLLALELGSYFTGEPLADQSYNPWKEATTAAVLRDYPALLAAVEEERLRSRPPAELA